MKMSTAQALQRAAEELGVQCDIRDAYSGRGMYGRHTWAVIVTGAHVIAPIAAQAMKMIKEAGTIDGQEETDLVQDLLKLRTDDMGFDKVVY